MCTITTNKVSKTRPKVKKIKSCTGKRIVLIYSTYSNQEIKLLQRQILKSKALLKYVGQALNFALNEQILPVYIQLLVQTPINPAAERH